MADLKPEVRPLPHGLNALILSKEAVVLLDTGMVTLDQLFTAEDVS